MADKEERGIVDPSVLDVRLDEIADQIVRAAPPFSARQRARIAAVLNENSSLPDRPADRGMQGSEA